MTKDWVLEIYHSKSQGEWAEWSKIKHKKWLRETFVKKWINKVQALENPKKRVTVTMRRWAIDGFALDRTKQLRSVERQLCKDSTG